MGKRTPLACALSVLLLAACSEGSSDIAPGQTHSSIGGAAGRDAGQGGADSGGSPARGAGGASNAGANGSGGRSGASGASAGGDSGASGSGAGGTVGTGGTVAAGGSSGSSGGQAGTPGSGGGVTTDASSTLCGTEPCASTRCAAWNCGAAVCCTIQTALSCVHGRSICPSPGAGEETGLLQCWGDLLNAYAFDKTCVQKSDCFVAEHYRGCCNLHAVGLNVADQSRFASFEQACGGAPPCGCCCDRVTAEDGNTPTSGTTPSVGCVAGLCKTAFP